MGVDYTSIDSELWSKKNTRRDILQRTKELPWWWGLSWRSKIVLMREMKNSWSKAVNVKPMFQKNISSMWRWELSDDELLNYGNLTNIFFNADLVKQFDELWFQNLITILQQAAKEPWKLWELELRIGLWSSKGADFSLRIPAYLNYIVYILKQLSQRQEETFWSVNIQNLPKTTIYSAANMVAEINNDDVWSFVSSRDYMFWVIKRFLKESLWDSLVKNISFVNDRSSNQYSENFSHFLTKWSENLLVWIQNNLHGVLDNSPISSILKTIQRKGWWDQESLATFLSQLDPESLMYSFWHAVYSQDVTFSDDTFESLLNVSSPTSWPILMIWGPSEIPYQALRNFVWEQNIDQKIQMPPIKIITNVDKIPPYLEPPYEDITLQTLEDWVPFDQIRRKSMFANELAYALQFMPWNSPEEQREKYVSMFS